ncbi:LOW QUALITY PROTEIN: Pao retrotransposon peptidase [Daphnia sinensis]|uniref:Pao retrotransposon peptidase n=1 Tax=Daphnia sinensis TaxID=1820382 RepID=A0AAD5KLB8_9CRUS|nr:LOW QUALITY PROTEIN: Pao retrotransposon peptidase [Daphnia sinensis]
MSLAPSNQQKNAAVAYVRPNLTLTIAGTTDLNFSLCPRTMASPATEIIEAEDDPIGCFPDELRTLQRAKPIRLESRLRKLAVYLDCTGIIGVGGRLENAHISPEVRHPAVLDPKHPLTKLFIARRRFLLLTEEPTERSPKFVPVIGC